MINAFINGKFISEYSSVAFLKSAFRLSDAQLDKLLGGEKILLAPGREISAKFTDEYLHDLAIDEISHAGPFSYLEISDMLGISYDAVRKTLERGLKKIRNNKKLDINRMLKELIILSESKERYDVEIDTRINIE